MVELHHVITKCAIPGFILVQNTYNYFLKMVRYKQTADGLIDSTVWCPCAWISSFDNLYFILVCQKAQRSWNKKKDNKCVFSPHSPRFPGIRTHFRDASYTLNLFELFSSRPRYYSCVPIHDLVTYFFKGFFHSILQCYVFKFFKSMAQVCHSRFCIECN